jgi:hypothetical protein
LGELFILDRFLGHYLFLFYGMSCLIELSNLLFSIGWVHVSEERWQFD